MSEKAKLRVCASCEWIFLKSEDTPVSGCPKCGFGHYGARFVYGDKCYRYAISQEPWLRRKVADYKGTLLTEIRETNLI